MLCGDGRTQPERGIVDQSVGERQLANWMTYGLESGGAWWKRLVVGGRFPPGRKKSHRGAILPLSTLINKLIYSPYPAAC
jgi:hypothetical protein